MEDVNIQMIIEGCLVNNQQARELLFQQVYAIGYPIAKLYAGTEMDATGIVENAYLYILDNLTFFDRTKLGFKSWVRQVVIDKGLDAGPPLWQAVFNLQAIEGYNEADISNRLNIKPAEVRQLYLEATGQVAARPIDLITASAEDVAAAWYTLAPIVSGRYSTDESAAMPLRASAKQRVAGGGWIGWAVLIGLSAIALVALGRTGMIKGNKIKVTKPPVTHLAAGTGYSLPCPNH